MTEHGPDYACPMSENRHVINEAGTYNVTYTPPQVHEAADGTLYMAGSPELLIEKASSPQPLPQGSTTTITFDTEPAP